MKRYGLLLLAVVMLAGMVGCATGSDWCANPENAKRYDGYENCIKAREKQTEPFGTY